MYSLQPVGYIRSTLRDLDNAPRQGSEGAPDAWLDVSGYGLEEIKHCMKVSINCASDVNGRFEHVEDKRFVFGDYRILWECYFTSTIIMTLSGQISFDLLRKD